MKRANDEPRPPDLQKGIEPLYLGSTICDGRLALFLYDSREAGRGSNRVLRSTTQRVTSNVNVGEMTTIETEQTASLRQWRRAPCARSLAAEPGREKQAGVSTSVKRSSPHGLCLLRPKT